MLVDVRGFVFGAADAFVGVAVEEAVVVVVYFLLAYTVNLLFFSLLCFAVLTWTTKD